MLRKASKERFPRLEVFPREGGKHAKSMCTEEMVSGFEMDLSGDTKDRENLVAVKQREGVRVEIYNRRGGRED